MNEPASHSDSESPVDPDSLSESAADTPDPASAKKKWLKGIFHGVILVVTLLFVGSNLLDAASDFREQHVKIRGVWLGVSLTTYCLGLAILGLPMWLVLTYNNEPVTLWQSTRAYLISHVGKYVPGKAMAIFIRFALLQPLGLTIGRVTLTSFYETFAAMASGSLMAILCLSLMPESNAYAASVAGQPWILWGTMGLLVLGFTAAITPIGFQLFTQLATMPFKKAQGYKDEKIDWDICLRSLGGATLSWIVIGISYATTVMAVSDKAFSFDLLVMSTAAVAFSIVIGFLSMIPGQAFVREAVLIGALAPAIGQLPAVMASLLFRLITLLAELGMAAILYLGGKR